MATKVERHLSDSGKLFETERDAISDDLLHRLIQATGNEPIARKARDAIMVDIESWRSTFESIMNLSVDPELPFVRLHHSSTRVM